MADLYTSLSNTAQKLIGKFGKSIIIRREIGGTFDPEAGETTGQRIDDQTVIAVVLPVTGSKAGAMDKRYKLGTLTFERLNYCNISGLDLSWIPTLNDKIVIDSEEWTILGITPLNPNSGDAIIYEVAFRI